MKLKKTIFNQIKKQNGLAVLLVVVVIGAVSLIMTKSAAEAGLSGLETAWTGVKANEVLIMGEACLEEVLRRWQINSSYSAVNASLIVGEGQCLINTSAVGNSRAVTVIAQSGEYYKKFKVEAIVNDNQITLNNWQEVSN